MQRQSGAAQDLPTSVVRDSDLGAAAVGGGGGGSVVVEKTMQLIFCLINPKDKIQGESPASTAERIQSLWPSSRSMV